jgi:hypothetical protein
MAAQASLGLQRRPPGIVERARTSRAPHRLMCSLSTWTDCWRKRCWCRQWRHRRGRRCGLRSRCGLRGDGVGESGDGPSPPVQLRTTFFPLRVRTAFFFLFFGRGFCYRPSSAARPPKKTRACLSQAPTKRGVCASLLAALLPVDATHVAAVPLTPAAISAKPPAVARPTGVSPPSNWPPSPSPLHGATRLLPTPVEHTSAYKGGPAFCVCARHTYIYISRGLEPPPRCARGCPF